MTRVLLIGIKPEAVDVSDPDLPPGTTPEKIAAGIDATLSDMKARGWEAAFCSIRQQVCHLTKRRQRRIPRRYIGQFGRHGRGLEVKGGEAHRYATILAWAGEQAPNPNWHVTE
ncbi:MAG: hypothetical protein ABSC06_11910 [Rhodopila sp.]|jgi:hypothetical protein